MAQEGDLNLSGVAEKRFNPAFENGGFWEYYKDLERQFENFLEYVPYLEGNENTYSFRLANLILAIGAHIDSAFKQIANYPEFITKYPLILKKEDGTPIKPTIWNYHPLAEEYDLSHKQVTFKCLPEREYVVPFAQYLKTKDKIGKDCINCPDWWNVYNKVKHEFSDNFKEANLKNVRDTLAGAFLLNVIHIPAALRLFNYGLFKQKYPITMFWANADNTFMGDKLQPKPPTSIVKDAFTIETSLFIYDYETPKDS